MSVVCSYAGSQLLDDLICRCMWLRERCLPFPTWIHDGVSTDAYLSMILSNVWDHVYCWGWSFDLYVQSMNEMQRSWIELKSTDSALIETHDRRWNGPCCHLCMILLHSSKFCLHMPSTTGSTSTLVYMYDDESLPVRLGHIHIYSPNLTTDDDRQEIEKKIAKSKYKWQVDSLVLHDYVYDWWWWWWMQMSYRTEAYRISITSSRNSADRNVAVALTCTLLCYWRKSFTIDSSH